MSMVKRSTTGCWTCRLRRKKCEEGGPPCQTCHLRGIFCHGYGPRPSWKDRGEREKEELRRINEQYSRRKKTRGPSLNNISFQLSESQDSGMTEIVPISTNSTETAPSVDMSTVNIEDALTASGLEILENFSPPAGGWQEADLFLQSGVDFDSYGFPADFEDSTGAPSLQPLPTKERGLLSSPTSEGLGFLADMHLPLASSDEESYEDEVHADFTMFYISNTFALQFPSYPESGKRGWLLNLLRCSPDFSTISLSISAYHQHLSGCSIHDVKASNHALAAYQTYRSAALQSLNSPKRHATSTDFNDFICLLQGASLEIFTGNFQSWHNHTHDAMQSFFRCAMSTLESAQHAFQKQAVQVFGAQLLQAAILSASLDLSTISNTAFDHHRNLLNVGNIDVEGSLGCQKWVLLVIMDIVELEHWKMEEQKSANLSIRELVRRVEAIELRLEQGLACAKDEHESVRDSATREDQYKARSTRVASITAVFATAAMVYVNTLASGCNPAVPEVQVAVNKAIAAWHALDEPWRFHSLKWPYCVTASLATENQRRFFRDMFLPASIEQQAFWNLSQLKSLTEDCWKRFDSQTADGNSSYDWRASARRMAIKLYLA